MNQSLFNKYKSFSSKDFAADDDFVRYVCHPTEAESLFWEAFCDVFPEKSRDVREAKLLIQALQPDHSEMFPTEVESLWNVLSTKQNEIFSSRQVENKVQPALVKKAFLMTAVVLLSCLSGALLSHLLKSEEIFEYKTGFEQVATVFLPDSSKVILNANSSIKMWTTGWLKKKREMTLTGEANFNIKKLSSSGRHHKLLVHTNSGTIEVTGTIFNVFSRGSKTKVYLKEGGIKLNDLPDLPVILMHPGDYIQYDVMDKTISLNIKDLSKWERKLFLKKTTIASFLTLKQDMETVKRQVIDEVEMTYLRHFDANMDKVFTYSEEILHFIDSHFDGETIRTGVDEEYDRQRTRLSEAETRLYAIQSQFNELLEQKEKKKSEYVKVHETEKNSIGLICTKRRAALLLKMTPLTTEVQSGSNVYLINPEIQTLCKTITTLRTTMEKEKERVFWMIVERMEAYQSKVNTIIVFVTRVDLVYTRAALAKRYKYCKPTLVHAGKSFVEAKQLRHALIEQLQTNELYVTNDIEVGRGTDGILLYGTNAVGKTSFIRALGIAVVLAQAGMYVPCTSFHFKPYESLFTRIIGNDNLFKGLSTFAVEMSELRTILKLANQNSLILGDELCSGTETQSAISIFVAGIQQFHREKSSFLFATHLHEIVDYDELQLDTVKMKHMSVVYDKASGALIYDRKLKDGPGDSMYGLEVCKSLSLPADFITAAYAIRQKYKPDSILSLKPSRYNAKKLVGACEQCGKQGKEIHHLQYQEDAVDGFIQTEDAVFPKNHLANLMTLCEKCHDVIHTKKMRMKKVKTSKGITHMNV